MKQPFRTIVLDAIDKALVAAKESRSDAPDALMMGTDAYAEFTRSLAEIGVLCGARTAPQEFHGLSFRVWRRLPAGRVSILCHGDVVATVTLP